MANFTITGPDGKRYKVSGENAEGALQALQQHVGEAAPQVGVGEDMAKGAAAGVAQGAIALPGMFGDVAKMNSDMMSGGAKYLGAPQWVQDAAGTAGKYMMGPAGLMPTSGQITKSVEGITGPMYEAKTVPGQYAQTAGQFAPSMLLGPGSVPMKAASALGGALGSETAGQLTKGSEWEPYARVAGGAAGVLAPQVARGLITPLPISKERQGLLSTLKKEGVDLTAGQSSGRQGLRYAESELGGSKGVHMMEKQGEQFTSAALKRAGITADRATPEVMDKAFTRIGNEFDGLASRNTMQPDAKLAKDVTDAVQSYVDVTTPTTRFDNVGKLANEILGSPNGIAGPKYQKLRSDIETIARKTKDGTHASALRDLKNAIDEAMERTLQANNSPDLGAWKKVRREYRNIIVLEQAATGAGEKAAEGLLSPSALRTATVTKHGRRNYARGTGDFADLARAGEATMKPLPQSGTAPRTAARNIGMSIPALLGGGAGASISPEMAMLGMIGGAGIPYAMCRGLLSKPARAYLGNQLLKGKRLSAGKKTALTLLGGSAGAIPVRESYGGQR